MLLHVCVCVSVAVPERSLRQRGGIVYVGLLWDVGLCWFWGRTGCPQGGGTAFTGLYPAAGPEGPSWSGSRACVRVSVAAARVFQNHQAPSFDFWLKKEILKRQPLALSLAPKLPYAVECPRLTVLRSPAAVEDVAVHRVRPPPPPAVGACTALGCAAPRRSAAQRSTWSSPPHTQARLRRARSGGQVQMADQASPATQQPPIVETWRLALAVAMFMTAS